MLWKVEINKGVFILGVVSMLRAVATTFQQDISSGTKACGFVLELLAGVGLCYGVIMQNPFYFLPSLIIYGAFSMFLIISFETPNRNLYFLEIEWLPYFIVTFCSVIKAFCWIRKNPKPLNSIFEA